LAVCGHHWHTSGAAKSRITTPLPVLGEQQATAPVVQSRAVRCGLSEHLDGMAAQIDRKQTETEQAAQLPGPAVAVSSATASSDREPDLVRYGKAVYALQDEFEGETELEFRDYE
jgi:hypothetical protein